MSLGIEEYLGAAHILGRGFLQVGPGQVVEIALVEKHLSAFVINVQKGLEIAKVVGSTYLFCGGVPKSDPVAFGYLEHQLGFQGTLDMNV
jgi:hypothetical protein